MAMVDGKYICDLCGCETDEVFTIDGKQVCPHCMDNPYRVAECHDCGALHLARNMDEDEDGNLVCQDCAENYDRCEDCGCLVSYGDGYYMENLDRFVCVSCSDDHYRFCELCRNWVHTDNWDFDYDCCEECAPADVLGCYHDHKHEHQYNMWGDDERKIGPEIEVDDGETYPERMAEELDYAYNNGDKKHLVFERDGSLSDRGLEIIGTPHDLDSFYAFDWKGMFDKLIANGYRSHDTSTCGLHLHFSKCWFGKTMRSRELGISRVVAMYELFYDDFIKASRRTERQAADWAKAYGFGWYRDSQSVYNKAKDIYHGYCGRYYAVNLCNTNTIEFRLGRGTLKYETFMAWVDLHATIAKNCHKVKNDDLYNLDRWFDGIKPETVDYLKSKGAFMDYVRKYELERVM